MRKRILSALLITFMILTMLPTASFAITDSDNYAYLYIAPDGSDDAAGTIDAPFATIGAARDKIREMKKAGEIPSKGVIVYLRGGDYGITEKTTFTSEDSGTEDAPIVYRSYPGEKAVIVGGASINLADVTPVTDDAILSRIVDEAARSQIMMVNLKKQGFHNLGEVYREGAYSYQTSMGFPSAPKARPLEFFCDGEIMKVSRYPNDGYMTIKKVLKEGFHNRNDGVVAGDPMDGIEITTDDKRYQNWTQASDAYLFGYWYYDWADASMLLERINLAEGSMETDWSSCYGVLPNQRFYAYNLLEEIDLPGEYYIDRKNGILYFYPLKPMDQIKELKISILDEDIIHITDKAEYIEFKDLKFSAIRCSAMDLSDCSHITVSDCEFEYTADYAIDIMYPDEPGTKLSDPPVTHCLIKNSYFHDVNGGIITYSAQDDPNITYTYNVFENNKFERFSRLTKTYTGAITLYGNGQVARYNEMSDGPHLAIAFGGQDNVIEYNNIHNVVKEGDDASAIYGGQTLVGRGLQIRYNYLHDIRSDSGQGVGRAAVYLDGGQNQVTMMGNVVANIEGHAFWLNGGQNNYVYNNILVDIDDGAVYFSDIMTSGVTEDIRARYRASAEKYLNNPVWREHYPEMMTQIENKDTTFLPLNCMIENNVTVNSKLMKYYGGAISYVNLKNNFDAKADPGFYDMGKKNFLLKPDAQVYKEIPGFNPVPFTRMGMYSDRALQRVKDAVVLAIGSPFARNKNEDTMIDADNLMVAPFIEDGTTFVPVRFIAEALGAKVDYNKDTREVTVASGTDTLVLTIDSLTAKKNGESVELVKAPKIKEGRTLLPLRNVAELLGKEVFWDNIGLIVISDDAELFSEKSDAEIIGYLHDYLDIH